jgi:hypothetical protein
VPISEKLFIGDLNVHVGSNRVGFNGVSGMGVETKKGRVS